MEGEEDAGSDAEDLNGEVIYVDDVQKSALT